MGLVWDVLDPSSEGSFFARARNVSYRSAMPWKNVEYTVQSIAERLKAEIQGAGADRILRRLASIEQSGPSDLAFCRKLPGTIPGCGALLCDASVAAHVSSSVPCIVVPDPIRALVEISPLFFEHERLPVGTHPTAIIDPSAHVPPSAAIGAYCVIGAHVVIGERAQLFPHVCLYSSVRLGNDVTIHAHAVVREGCDLADGVVLQPGAVIGADGFGYIPDPKLGIRHVPQMGAVKLSEAVEIGANSCVDRGTLGNTTIGPGTKLDNLVQVGHNVQIGRFSMLCGQVGIGGSAVVGDQVILGGNSGVADHITVASKVRVAAKAGVVQDIAESGDYGGHPAVPAQQWRRMVVALGSLPDRLRKLNAKTKHEE